MNNLAVGSIVQPMAKVSSVTPVVAADYLLAYTERYRTEYGRFTSAPPEGSGYPALATSPYIDGDLLTCHLATDGYAIADESGPPEYRWDIAGGPAILTDVEPSRVPEEITQLLKGQGLYGKNICLGEGANGAREGAKSRELIGNDGQMRCGRPQSRIPYQH